MTIEDFLLPFRGQLSVENRWAKLSKLNHLLFLHLSDIHAPCKCLERCSMLKNNL